MSKDGQEEEQVETLQGNSDVPWQNTLPILDSTEQEQCKTKDNMDKALSPDGPKLRDRHALQVGPVNSMQNQSTKCTAATSCTHTPIRTLSKAKKYACTFCLEMFVTQKLLSLHTEQNHAEMNATDKLDPHAEREDESEESTTGINKFECTYCDKIFSGLKTLSRHVLAKHTNMTVAEGKKSEKKKSTQDADGRFMCDTCDKTFKTERILQKHIQTHSGEYSYKCEQCGKGYYNFGSYRAHLSTHTGEKHFTCKQCGKGFPHSSSYNFHIRTAHLTTQNFQCSICNRKYKSQKYLKDHMQSVHIEPDRYRCSICDRTFGHRASLFMHMKTHADREGKVKNRKGKQDGVKPKVSSDVDGVKLSAPSEAGNGKSYPLPPLTQVHSVDQQASVSNTDCNAYMSHQQEQGNGASQTYPHPSQATTQGFAHYLPSACPLPNSSSSKGQHQFAGILADDHAMNPELQTHKFGHQQQDHQKRHHQQQQQNQPHPQQHKHHHPPQPQASQPFMIPPGTANAYSMPSPKPSTAVTAPNPTTVAGHQASSRDSSINHTAQTMYTPHSQVNMQQIWNNTNNSLHHLPTTLHTGSAFTTSAFSTSANHQRTSSVSAIASCTASGAYNYRSVAALAVAEPVVSSTVYNRHPPAAIQPTVTQQNQG